MTYKQGPGVLSVQEEDGPAEYRYALKGDVLQIVFPEGTGWSVVGCSHQREPPRWYRFDSGKQFSGARAAQRRWQWQHPRTPGVVLQLWWKFGSSSSYSRSTRVFFDGQGGLVTVRSHPSAVGRACIRFPGGGANSGRYRVEGNRVVLTFATAVQGWPMFTTGQGTAELRSLCTTASFYAPQLCD